MYYILGQKLVKRLGCDGGGGGGGGDGGVVSCVTMCADVVNRVWWSIGFTHKLSFLFFFRVPLCF